MKGLCSFLLSTFVILALNSGMAFGGGGSSVGDGPVSFTQKESRTMFRILGKASGTSMKKEHVVNEVICTEIIIPKFPVTCELYFANGCSSKLDGNTARSLFDLMDRHYVPKDPELVGAVTLEANNIVCQRWLRGRFTPHCSAF